MKPGMTGWAQVNGLRGETREPASMHERVRYDLSYVQSWSLTLDLLIVVRTLREVILPRNAY
jgi:lipopolysaccharide/colanic/teichoic acid biosynthesis glycosyltransferase